MTDDETIWVPRVDDRYPAAVVRDLYDARMWTEDTLPQILDTWCRRQPDKQFVSDGDGTLTYAELRGQAYRLAAQLRTRGIGAGDRVVVQLPNWREFVVTWLALTRIGAVLVPIMNIYRHDEVEYILNLTQAKAVVTTGMFRGFDHLAMVRELRPKCPTVELVVAVRAKPEPQELAFEVLANPDAGTVVPDSASLGSLPHADELLLVIFTSGTESRPKGCVHTTNTFSYSMRTLSSLLRLTADDVAFGPSPIAHATGLIAAIGCPLYTGGSVNLLDVWEPKLALDRIKEHGCTYTVTASPFVQMALDAFDPDLHDVATLRVWGCGGAPVPGVMVERATAAWPACRLLSLYGRSEVFLSTICRLDEPPQRAVTSDGRSLDGTEVVALDSGGSVVPATVEGEIAQRGPGVMLGYWRDPERTAELFDEQGWCHSGDLGRVDEDGYLRVTGRLKDLIIRGGVNISAREVEDHLLAHPKVKNVALVAMPDKVLGERACAFVVPELEAPTLDELCDFLRHDRRISVTKLPERLEIVAILPTTATGKIQKYALREQVRKNLAAETATK
jgi:acyl-CoA synthetase (AMP-forming)/AMP-acid ligase II